MEVEDTLVVLIVLVLLFLSVEVLILAKVAGSLLAESFNCLVKEAVLKM